MAASAVAEEAEQKHQPIGYQVRLVAGLVFCFVILDSTDGGWLGMQQSHCGVLHDFLFASPDHDSWPPCEPGLGCSR